VMAMIYDDSSMKALPHKSDVRPHRVDRVYAFWVVLEGGTWTAPFTVFLPEGKEAIALFSAEEEAMMFCHLSKLGKKGSIRQTTAGGVLSLLYGPWAVARHVALDPLPEILGGGLLGLLTLGREHFARSFAGGWEGQ
jgi:ABC-type Co2+ transport system permease subunit